MGEERIEPKVGVVIVAAGSGSRMGEGVPKQFRFIDKLPMLAHSINRFAEAYPTSEIVVVLSEDRVDYWKNLSSRFEVAKHDTAIGGAQRFDSVRSGIAKLSEGVDVMAVHDGARPFVSVEVITRCVEQAVRDGSAVPAVEVKDSVRQLAEHGSQLSTSLDRSLLRAVQTPQCFDAVTLRRAYMQSYSPLFTDDASVVESLGERVWLCDGDNANIKVTTIEDLH